LVWAEFGADGWKWHVAMQPSLAEQRGLRPDGANRQGRMLHSAGLSEADASYSFRGPPKYRPLPGIDRAATSADAELDGE